MNSYKSSTNFLASFFFTEPVDMKEVINQTVMEVLFKIKDSDSNPVLNLKPATPDVSPVKNYGSSPMG